MINLREKTMLFNPSITINDLFEEFINNEDKRPEIAKKIDDKTIFENFDSIKCNAILANFSATQEFAEVGFDKIYEMIKKLFFNGFFPDASNLEKLTRANFKIAILNEYDSNQLQEINIAAYSDFYQNKIVEINNLKLFVDSIIAGIDYYNYCCTHDEEFNKKNPLLIKYNGKILGFSANQLYRILSADIKINEVNQKRSFNDYLNKNKIYGRKIEDFKRSIVEQQNILCDVVNVFNIRRSIESQNRESQASEIFMPEETLSLSRYSQSSDILAPNSQREDQKTQELINDKLQLKSDLFRNSGSIEIPATINSHIALASNRNDIKSPNCFRVLCRTLMSCLWPQDVVANQRTDTIPSSSVQNPVQIPSSLQLNTRDVLLE